MKTVAVLATALTLGLASAPAAAACSDSGRGFSKFKKDFASYARQNGVGRRGLQALASTKY